jgi:hypothetical protein
MGNPVVHFEIYGSDTSKLRKFYAETFGWKCALVPDESYSMVNTDSGGEGIGGGIAQSPDGNPRVMFYVQVPDINVFLERIKAAGGSVVMERTDYSVVITAMATDPAGNIIGLTEEQTDLDKSVH